MAVENNPTQKKIQQDMNFCLILLHKILYRRALCGVNTHFNSEKLAGLLSYYKCTFEYKRTHSHSSNH